MYSGSKLFGCAIFYLVVIWWKGVILANVYEPATSDTTLNGLTVNVGVNRSEILNIVYGVLNATRTKPTSPSTSLDLSNARINSLSICGCSDGQIATNKRPISIMRDDYTQIQDSFYKLHRTKLTWYGAYKACVDENAHLIVINSVKEVDVIHQLIKVGENIEYVYVGIHDMFREGEWITINGESLQRAGYDGWAPNEPNDFQGNEDCAIMHMSGQMNDVPCSLESYYVCEASL